MLRYFVTSLLIFFFWYNEPLSSISCFGHVSWARHPPGGAMFRPSNRLGICRLRVVDKHCGFCDEMVNDNAAIPTWHQTDVLECCTSCSASVPRCSSALRRPAWKTQHVTGSQYKHLGEHTRAFINLLRLTCQSLLQSEGKRNSVVSEAIHLASSKGQWHDRMIYWSVALISYSLRVTYAI